MLLPFLLVLATLLPSCSASPLQFRQPLWGDNIGLNVTLKRSVSQDPSCPSGFFCDQQACPENVFCETGKTCINFEGNLACVPTSTSWCAINPSTLEVVGCLEQGTCCHGNCYTSDAVCCDIPSVTCTIGTLCNACGPGQTCLDGNSATTCEGSGQTSTSTSKSSSKSTSTPNLPTTSSTQGTTSTSSGTKSTTSTTISFSLSTSQSASASATPTPSIVSSVGTFTFQGCFTENPDSRVLVYNSETDDTGMTVEECVAFAQSQGVAYAGVEFGSQCFVGNTLHGAFQDPNSDCDQICAGNVGEYCGSADRIQIYLDTSWTNPTLEELTDVLLQYNSTLWQLQNLVSQYQSLISEWAAQQNGTQQSRRGAVKRDLTAPQLETQLTTIKSQYANLLSSLEDEAAQGEVLFVRGSTTADLVPPSNPFVDPPTLTEAETTFDVPLQSFSNVQDVIEDDLATIASTADSQTPLINTEADLGAAEDALAVVGLPELSAVVSVAAGTGIFFLIASIFFHLHPATGSSNPTGGGNPTNSATMTSSSATSSTSTCSPTLSPTPMVVLTQINTVEADAETLLSLMPKGSLIDEDYYPEIGYRAFLATLDDCDADILINQSSVATVSINAVVSDLTDEEPSGPFKRFQPNDTKFEIDNATFSVLQERVLAAGKDLTFQSPTPFHLKWLSSLWAKAQSPALAGSTNLDTDGFLYDSTAGGNQVTIYVLDTGISPVFSDFDNVAGNSKITTNYIARTKTVVNIGSDGSGHGTLMASCAAGYFNGVAKSANLVAVQVTGYITSATLYDFMSGLAWSTNQVKANPAQQGLAVFSMSWGFNFIDLDWKPTVAQNPTGHFDPFPRLFSQYVYPQGIVAVNAASNDATDDLALQEPTGSGGATTGLIVVGNAAADGTNGGSTVVDSSNSGILSIYANGVSVCAAAKAAPFDYICETGSSPATAQVAGLAAYYLSIPTVQTNLLGMAGGLGSISLNMKNYLRAVATSRKGNYADGVPRAAIDEELNCQTTNPPKLIVPALPAPAPTKINELYLDTYPTLVDAGGDLDLSVAQLAAANGLTVVLNPLPSCVLV